MPVYESPALYIDFARLPPPKVLEDVDFEKLLNIYKGKVVELMPSLKKAVGLEQSPTNVILQAEAYGEMLVRARVNAAARSVMLPFANGSDLDVLASLYHVYRDPIVENPRSYVEFPEDWETDDRLRNRAQNAPEAFAMAGTAGSYRFHAMAALPTLRDASAIRLNDQAGIKITLMKSGANPSVSAAEIAKVRDRLESKNIKPLTDVLTISSVTRKTVEIDADVTLYPGPESSVIKAEITSALIKLKDRVAALGRDLTRSAIIATLNREGVLDVVLNSPTTDTLCEMDQCVVIASAAVRISSERRE